MRLFLEKDFKCAYVLPKRCGSSLFCQLHSNISSIKNSYTHCNHFWSQVLPSLNSDSTIYFTYREPFERYMSGVSLVLDGLGLQTLATTYIRNKNPIVKQELYKNLQSIFLFARDIKYHTGIKLKTPYHLVNPHCSHVLWVPVMLAEAGYNVELIHLDDYSAHLNEKFRGSTGTYVDVAETELAVRNADHKHALRSLYWELLQNVFSDVKGMNPNDTFNNWMQPEKDVYQVIKDSKLIGQGLDDAVHIMNNTNYLSDVFFPNWEIFLNLFDTLISLGHPINPSLLKRAETMKTINHAAKDL